MGFKYFMYKKIKRVCDIIYLLLFGSIQWVSDIGFSVRLSITY